MTEQIEELEEIAERLIQEYRKLQPAGISREAYLIQQVAREIFEEMFPPKIYPRHLEYWAEQISKEQGYDSQLTNFLARLATNWQSHKSKYLKEEK